MILLDEIVDRYGEPPKGVLNLVDVALLRAQAQKAGICDIRQKAGDVSVTLTHLDFQQVSRVWASPQYKNRLFLQPMPKNPLCRLHLTSGSDSLRQVRSFVEQFAAAAGPT